MSNMCFVGSTGIKRLGDRRYNVVVGWGVGAGGSGLEGRGWRVGAGG